MFDKYSLLHFAVGVMFYFLFDFKVSVLVHIVFEIVENTKWGMGVINDRFKWWPGGKTHADSLINSTGDTIAFAIGWIVAYKLYGKR